MVLPAEQAAWHDPPSHSGVAAPQDFPHPPQLAAELAEASQPGAPSQSRLPWTQPHLPPTQRLFSPQFTPQAPHDPTDEREASQPSSALPLQSAKPGAHSQDPPTQT